MNRYLVILSLFVLISTEACKEDENQQIPLVPVEITLNLDLPSNNILNSVGSYIYITGGSNGIVVYNLDGNEFIALDRHCPYQVDAFERVQVDSTNIILVDQACGSRFSLLDGQVLEGPAAAPLQSYNTSFNATTRNLRIFN